MGKDCYRQYFYISAIPGGHAGGTIPRTGEGRTMQDDSMDGTGRVVSGTETEQLPRPRFISCLLITIDEVGGYE